MSASRILKLPKSQPVPVSVLWREYAWNPRVSVSKPVSTVTPETPVSLRMLRLGHFGFHAPAEASPRLPASIDWHQAMRQIPPSVGGNFSAPADCSLSASARPGSRRLSVVFKYQSGSFPL